MYKLVWTLGAKPWPLRIFVICQDDKESVSEFIRNRSTFSVLRMVMITCLRRLCCFGQMQEGLKHNAMNVSYSVSGAANYNNCVSLSRMKKGG